MLILSTQNILILHTNSNYFDIVLSVNYAFTFFEILPIYNYFILGWLLV